MLYAHTVADVRAAEAALMAQVPPGSLMRWAAAGLAAYVREVVPGASPVVFLVGTGDNGGDALFAAAELARERYVAVALADPSRVHGPGAQAAQAAGCRFVDSPRGFAVVVDGIVGIGGSPGLRAPADAWRDVLAAERPFVIAVDVPSGVDVDGATLPGSYIAADATCTFGTYKNALLVDPAATRAVRGALPRLVDIGLGPFLPPPSVEALTAGDNQLLLAILRPTLDERGEQPTQKYTRGVVGVAAGSAAYAGAAQLCVRGAQAGIAGMVRFVGEPSLAARIVDRCPEVVAHTDPAARGRVQAWVVGSGGGDDAADRLAMALEDEVPVVVDADALTHLPERLPVPALLTPHAGELARMLDVTRSDVVADPLGHATRAAERWGATVLLKGARTLVAYPGSPTRVNLSGTPWLATAGAGDVLAGLAGSFLAAGAHPRDAGSLAAFVHGAAAVAASGGGPVTATRVADAVPGVIAAWRNGTLTESQVRDWRDR
ncbi:bifunctional ADP-dependent NAD(P)H-hydrate dehydratase/NAD(P)H-hydrate epimerase [Mumia sp. ZJ430]|uniref:bifunctional ADP-dependent NAD(P)H-hydrate dehydratase/NAD(P)H-hydrate epimerase n=1 Tax=Mumia sp. ZJ430 TaxID=2708083 RepID=UPI00141F1012|nr:bifunctional ADP-dependent NAD(P)H-hydrate dehydratase/NAD(P)H-hydrate epimerase [Mumia sp. ZJ430]